MVQFTKLRLSGFKSFLYPTEIEIGPGKTGVVGPNGCGKSNLLEALSWVMGENSAKRMRGAGMEDVIFNGTNTKSARSSAEVTVWLDNQDRTAPPPYHDTETLEITRYIERGSGSDYKINGKSVRAKDVQLLFADLVSGANSPALVSQGRITAIIQAKPKDRRRILEDAAGISGLHARRHESELKLKATENNLERLADVITTQESHLTTLKKQARQASRYRNLSDHIKHAQANLYAYKWQQINNEEKTVKSQFDSIEAEIRKKISFINDLTTKQAKAQGLIPDLRTEEAKAAAILQRLLIEKENHEATLKRQQESLTKATKELESAQSELETETQTIKNIDDQISQLEAEKTESTQHQINDKSTIDNLDKKLTSLTAEIEKTQTLYNEINQKIISRETEVTGLQNQRIALEGQIANLVEEKKKYEERLDQLKIQQQQQTLFDGLKTDIEHGEKEISKLKSQRDKLEEEKQEQEQSLSKQRQALNEKQSDYTRLKAEHDALSDIVHSGQSSDNHPPLLDQITVEEGYETALATALGDGLTYPLIEESLIYWSKLGQETIAQSLPEGVQAILDIVKAPENLNRALSQIGLINDLESGEINAKKLLAGQIIVSKKGDLLRWDGLVIKADAPSASAIKLQQKNRLTDLVKALSQAKTYVELEENKLEKNIQILDKIKTSLQENKTTLSSKEDFLSSQRFRLGSLQEEYHALKNDLTSLTTSLSRIDEDFEKTTQQLQHVKDSLQLKQDFSTQANERNRLQEQLSTLKETAKSTQDELNNKLRQQDRESMRLEQIEREIKTLEANKETTKKRIPLVEERIQRAANELKELSNTHHNNESRQNANRTSSESLEQKILTASKNREEKAQDLNDAENISQTLNLELRQKETELSAEKEKRAVLQATYSNCKQKINDLSQALKEDFDLNIQQLIRDMDVDLEAIKSQSLDTLTNRLNRLKNERDTMGPVNLRAEIEAEEVNAEIERFKTEEEELTSAITKLRSAISKINKEARERLIEAFGKVDSHFRTLFADLFGGGKAYLQLTNDDDPLTAGLEIFAQPPGKKLQNLTLLSGGEQTLTSIALVFGMFLTNPSPICVLDEIDAALDDVNVDRVCNALDRMAQKGDTRFLVISHHRMSVARMDRLYGVTMAQRGISQLVSVDLSQADLLNDTIAA